MSSRRASEIHSFLAMDIMQQANELQQENIDSQQKTESSYSKILRLEVGQPSTSLPNSVIVETLESLTSEATIGNKAKTQLGYTPSLGLQSFRDAIARHYQRTYNLDEDTVSADDIIVTTGASNAFVALFAAAFDTTSHVAVSIPGYPCYRHVLKAFDINMHLISTTAENDFQPTLAQLESLPENTKGLIIASPTNPTGSCLSHDQLTQISQFCQRRDILLIADEIYHGISQTFIPSVLQIPSSSSSATIADSIVCIGSMSKFWCMTGFRVGWLITKNKVLLHALDKCIQNMNICAPSISQHVATSVLENTQHQTMFKSIVSSYFNAIDLLVDRLTVAGFQVPVRPKGAFYVYAQCTDVCKRLKIESSLQLCQVLLKKCGVAAGPGLDFDHLQGEHFVRFSCAGAVEDIVEAGDRVVQFMSLHPHVQGG